MRTSTGLVLGLFAASVLAGCSETKVQNLLGSNKASTDEEQVPVGQTLSMPPDLELRPPAGGGDTSETKVAAQSPPPAEPADVEAAPADVEPVPVEQSTQTAMATPQQPPAQAAAQPPKQDIYERYGISKVNEDGTPKTEKQLRMALREAQLAEKRKTNPKYGTIWNIGNVFSDDD